MWGEKKTKIVATLSDFRANEEFVRGLFEAGMDVVRINSAHVTEEGAAKIVVEYCSEHLFTHEHVHH